MWKLLSLLRNGPHRIFGGVSLFKNGHTLHKLHIILAAAAATASKWFEPQTKWFEFLNHTDSIRWIFLGEFIYFVLHLEKQIERAPLDNKSICIPWWLKLKIWFGMFAVCHCGYNENVLTIFMICYFIHTQKKNVFTANSAFFCHVLYALP